MIQINANVPSEINVDFDISGNEVTPSLRLYLSLGDFFVGFNGNNNRINMPKMDNISFPESKIIAKIEVILGNYNIKIWEEEIEIIQDKNNLTETSINRIKIKIKLKEEPLDESKPIVKLTPKF